MPVASSAMDSASEGDDDLVRGSDVIVIHPGTNYVRLGFATDPLPVTIPHCIGRRFKTFHDTKQQVGDDDKATHAHDSEVDSESDEEEEEKSVSLDNALAESVDLIDQAMKQWRGARKKAVASAVAQITASNEEVTPERIPAHMDDDDTPWSSISDGSIDWVPGDKLSRVRPTADLQVNYPFKHGMLNTSGKRSQEAIKADLRDIWTSAIETHLNVNKSKFKDYRTLVIIPDMYRRRHVRAIIEVLLGDLGFSAVLLHQESVCATFGAGVSTACVVDVGASKISVSCVEEGVSLQESRVLLKCGGNEVTRLFHTMLKKIAFPYRECNLQLHTDWELMNSLKESLCQLQEDGANVEEHEFRVRRPDALTLKYRFEVGDETFRAPLSMFVPGALSWHGPDDFQLRTDTEVDPTDTFDEAFIQQASMQNFPIRFMYGQRTKAVNVSGSTAPASGTAASAVEASDAKADENPDEAKEGGKAQQTCKWEGCDHTCNDLQTLYGHVMETHVNSSKDDNFICLWAGCSRAKKPFTHRPSITAHIRSHMPGLKFEKPAIPAPQPGSGRETPLMERSGEDEDEQQELSIDEAIHHAIQLCGGDELKRRMYNTILLTGGGYLFRGFVPMLEQCLRLTIPDSAAGLASVIQVLTNIKDLDPRILAWKGGSILARLDQADDYWVEHDEWQERGVGLLRDVLPFVW